MRALLCPWCPSELEHTLIPETAPCPHKRQHQRSTLSLLKSDYSIVVTSHDGQSLNACAVPWNGRSRGIPRRGHTAAQPRLPGNRDRCRSFRIQPTRLGRSSLPATAAASARAKKPAPPTEVRACVAAALLKHARTEHRAGLFLHLSCATSVQTMVC